MIITKNLIADSTTIYSAQAKWLQDSLVAGQDYEIDLDIETKNPNGGKGMNISTTNSFYLDYPLIRILSNVELVQDYDTSGVSIQWAGIHQNPATLTGSYTYVDDFVRRNNIALSLSANGVLTYNSSTIPIGFTLSFMDLLPRNKDGLIFQTNDGQYLFGYNNAQQKFYTTIQGVTDWSEIIKICDNPFVFYITPQQVIIRQYNVYRKLSECKNIPLNSISGMPLAFMIQTNN